MIVFVYSNIVCKDLFKSLENEYIPSNTPEKAIKKMRNNEDNIVTYNCWLEKEIKRISIITPTTANTSPHFIIRMGALCGADITSVILLTISGLLYFLKSIISNLHSLHFWSFSPSKQ